MNILFIACYSPMINNSASIETLQYLNNLAKIHDNTIQLLTVDFPNNSVYYDEEVLKLLDPKVNIHKVSGGVLFEKVMPKKGKSEALANTTKQSTIKRKIKNIIAIPDMYLNWAYKASRVGCEIVKKYNIDIIFSMHEPPSSHICAEIIKRKFSKIPWVTYWSDPWLKDSSREGVSKLRLKIESSFEEKIIKNSDRYIFVTEANREDYITSYGIEKAKTHIITRGYEKELYDDIRLLKKGSKLSKDKVNIVYAGEIFKKLRDINPFVEAINNTEIIENSNIMFFGNIDDIEAKNNLKAIKNTTVENRIPYKEALNYVINSEILLIFGNKNSKQIPAKIYDYFGCDGYILIILGDENDPILEVVKDKDRCIVVNNNPDEIEKALKGLIQKVKVEGLKKEYIEYEWSNIAQKLNNVLKGGL